MRVRPVGKPREGKVPRSLAGPTISAVKTWIVSEK